MVASIPPVQILDGVRVDTPATVVGAPVRVHNPEISIFSPKVEDEPLRALAVCCEEGVELRD